MKNSISGINPWEVWIIFFAAASVYISLFVISSVAWHVTISLMTLIVLWRYSPTPPKTLGFILGLVGFLAVLQICFSPYMRKLFFDSLAGGFVWADWQYLLVAIERFAWPLVIVSTFQTRLSDPAIIAQLTDILLPLKWLGIKIGRIQILVVLSLRFIPSLRLEWERFTKFQLYFLSGSPKKTLLEKLRFWLGVFKAMLSHTIHRSITVGDLLALRGLPDIHFKQTSSNVSFLFLVWLSLGLIFLYLDRSMVMVWLGMSVWLAMVFQARRTETQG